MEEVFRYLGTLHGPLWFGAFAVNGIAPRNIFHVLQGSRIFGRTSRQVGFAEL